VGELVHWSLKISRETDIAVRSLLATRGGKRGDLTTFVEDAVNTTVLREITRDVHARNADRSPEDVKRLIDGELAELDDDFWPEHRR
jgi:hypothetical protein